jgi:hypothetical protein
MAAARRWATEGWTLDGQRSKGGRPGS